MGIIDISELTGIVICYAKRAEMDKVHSLLKDLKQKDPEFNSVGLGRAFNPEEGVPYPWTLALILIDGSKFAWLDDYLTDNHLDLGENKELYAGQPRIQDFLRMLSLEGKYEPGMVKIKTGTCPINGLNPVACFFCRYGHLLECHYPLDCEKAQCSHWQKYDMEGY